MKSKLLIFILIAGVVSACGSQPAEAPASPPTEEPAPATEAPAPASAPTEEAAAPTEVPAEQPTTEPAASTGVSFANDVLPILNSRCLNCHGGDRIEEGLLMRTHAELMTGSDNGPVIIPGDAQGSLLVELVSTLEMPKRGPKLTPPQIQLIVDWVNQGALDN
jgi:mono/diheme cytochrome c family protein